MRLVWLTLALITTSTFCSAVSASPLDDQDGTESKLWSPFEGWKAPSFMTTPPKEPAFVKATRQTLGAAWAGTKRTTKSAWDKTLYVLRPYDKEPNKRRSATVARRDADAGFWSNLFGKSSKQEPMTVNEFLRQPAPY